MARGEFSKLNRQLVTRYNFRKLRDFLLSNAPPHDRFLYEGIPDNDKESSELLLLVLLLRAMLEGFQMPKDWLQRKLTMQEAEDQHTVFDDGLGNEGVPFGSLNHEWKALVAEMIEGDELWEFRSPEYTWRLLAGRAGVALVRNGEVVDAIVTVLN